jgi:hypothetical protein
VRVSRSNFGGASRFSKIRSLAALLSSFVDDTFAALLYSFKAGTDHPHHAKQGYKTEAASKIGQPENRR